MRYGACRFEHPSSGCLEDLFTIWKNVFYLLQTRNHGLSQGAKIETSRRKSITDMNIKYCMMDGWDPWGPSADYNHQFNFTLGRIGASPKLSN